MSQRTALLDPLITLCPGPSYAHSSLLRHEEHSDATRAFWRNAHDNISERTGCSLCLPRHSLCKLPGERPVEKVHLSSNLGLSPLTSHQINPIGTVARVQMDSASKSAGVEGAHRIMMLFLFVL